MLNQQTYNTRPIHHFFDHVLNLNLNTKWTKTAKNEEEKNCAQWIKTQVIYYYIPSNDGIYITDDGFSWCCCCCCCRCCCCGGCWYFNVDDGVMIDFVWNPLLFVWSPSILRIDVVSTVSTNPEPFITSTQIIVNTVKSYI